MIVTAQLPIGWIFGGGPPPPAPPAGAAAEAPGTGLARRILIVEDEIMIAWWMQTAIEEMGYGRVDIVASGEAALDAVARDAPALLVMDINLGPGLDGIATAERIRETGKMPVIFVSAYADEATRERIARNIPGATLMRKPVPTEAFQQAVRAALDPKARPN